MKLVKQLESPSHKSDEKQPALVSRDGGRDASEGATATNANARRRLPGAGVPVPPPPTERDCEAKRVAQRAAAAADQASERANERPAAAAWIGLESSSLSF